MRRSNYEMQIKQLSVLSEQCRIEIVRLIASCGELRAMDILPEFDITQPTLSHHISLLRENDIIIARQEGRCTYYSINKEVLSGIADFLTGLCEQPVVNSVLSDIKSSRRAKPEVKKEKVLKNKTSVPEPKYLIESPDLEEIKKEKKKKKDKNKKNSKEKSKKKKK